MKIIDLLNLKAEGKLEDGFTFVFDNRIWTYSKNWNESFLNSNNDRLGSCYCLENCLNDKIILLRRKNNVKTSFWNVIWFSINIYDFR